MNTRFLNIEIRSLLLVALLGTISATSWFAGGVCARAGEAEEADINRFATKAKALPIKISGYAGEAASVLQFDLYMAGFDTASTAAPEYTLEASGTTGVGGRLTDVVGKKVLFDKAFSGGSGRSQAHALADEVVEAITGKPGIASRAKIAFKVRKGQNFELYVADYDGYNAKQMTQDDTVLASPSWAPNTAKIYYTTYKFGNADIVWQDLKTGERKSVARYSGSNMSPAASPDGRYVAFVASKSGSPDIYVAGASGENPRQITVTREDESSPCWSPDGMSLCFATKMNGRRILATASANGGSVKQLLTRGAANPSEPSWSPDGKEIAFTSQMKDFFVCTVPAAGGEAQVLVAGEDAAWGPNSRTLILTRRLPGGKRTLSLLDVPTKHMKDVGQSLGECSQPCWGRLSAP